jgi:acyl transferase domain-containing protein
MPATRYICNGDAKEPIAIVGLGCRFPGGSDSPSKLWDLLKNPHNVATRIPPERFNIDRFYHENNQHNGTCNVKETYFLDQDIRCFDHSFFGIPPSGKFKPPLKHDVIFDNK